MPNPILRFSLPYCSIVPTLIYYKFVAKSQRFKMLSYNTPAPVNGQLNGQFNEKINGHLNGQLNGASSSTNTVATMAPPVRPLGNNPKPIPVPAGPVTSHNTIAKVYGHASPKHHHIWLVTGPAGCGKTTVAKYLSTNLKVPYIEGDDVS